MLRPTAPHGGSVLLKNIGKQKRTMRQHIGKTVVATLLALTAGLFWVGAALAQTQIAPSSIVATASSSYPGFPASAATDNNGSTFWNAGQSAGPGTYIEFDLGADTALHSMQLVVSQSPSGSTSHTVTGRTAAGSNVNFSTLSGSTSDGQMLSLSLTGTTAVRYVRVTTTVSPSWVAWYEVRFYKVAQTGTLTASPSSCSVPSGQTFCSTSPSLTATVSSGSARVWVSAAPAGAPEAGAWVFATTGSSSVAVSWIREGSYTFQLRSGTTNTGTLLASTTITGVPLSSASFVSQLVPSTMIAGQSYAVSLTFTNTGATTWTSGAGFKLGSQNPQDNTTWGVSRATLAANVAPGQQATFNFNVTAPSTPGNYNFQWRMLQEGTAWFGSSSTNVVVTSTNSLKYDQFAPYLSRTVGYLSGGVQSWKSDPYYLDATTRKIDIYWSTIEQHEIRKNCSDGKSYVWVSYYKTTSTPQAQYPITATKVLLKRGGVTTDLTNVCGSDGHVYALYDVDSVPYTVEVWGNIAPAVGLPPDNTFYWKATYSLVTSTNTCWLGDANQTRMAIHQEEAWWDNHNGWDRGASGTLGADNIPTGSSVQYSTYFEIAKNAGYMWKFGSLPGASMTLPPACLESIGSW